MLDKLDALQTRFKVVEKEVAEPEVIKDLQRYKELMQEHSHLSEIVSVYDKYKQAAQGIKDAQGIISKEQDADMLLMAKEELAELNKEKSDLEDELKVLLVPKDPLDKKNIIMEIRAGTGGDEAALFAADLYRMYSRYAEKHGWKTEIMESNEIELGGFKEVSFSISGKNVYENLRYESGVHRVQRVPETESGGRVHTSAITVAVLPEAEETDVNIKNEDLKIDVYRSSGPGGQSVNTTDSAVRITHIPTGTIVTCQDEKSQHKNRAKALRVLRSRILESEVRKQQSERAQARRMQIGSGDRSERIRTYNFPQNRLTDHRISLTLYKLDSIVEGNLDEVIAELKMNAQEELLTTQES